MYLCQCLLLSEPTKKGQEKKPGEKMLTKRLKTHDNITNLVHSTNEIEMKLNCSQANKYKSKPSSKQVCIQRAACPTYAHRAIHTIVYIITIKALYIYSLVFCVLPLASVHVRRQRRRRPSFTRTQNCAYVVWYWSL